MIHMHICIGSIAIYAQTVGAAIRYSDRSFHSDIAGCSLHSNYGCECPPLALTLPTTIS